MQIFFSLLYKQLTHKAYIEQYNELALNDRKHRYTALVYQLGTF